MTDPTDIRRDLVSLLPRLRRFALAFCGQPEAVDELVREACASAVLKAPKLANGDRLESFVFSIIRTIWAEERKKPLHSDDEAHANGFAQHEAILSLPDGAAASFLLVAVEEHNYAETAAILDIDVETVAHHLLLARQQFAGLTIDNAERRA